MLAIADYLTTDAISGFSLEGLFGNSVFERVETNDKYSSIFL